MSANHGSGRDHTVIDIPDDHEKRKKCIFRVPNVLWRQNPKAYTPDVVSIGPFHHDLEKRGKKEGKGGKKGNGEKYFQLMERVKNNYLKEILAMKNITLEELTAKVTELSDQKNEGGLEERARGFEQHARDFYAEPLYHISSEDFIEMMTVDGCFLIQLFRKRNDPKLRAFDDPIFDMDCMFHFLCHDILLLENQLPWFVIHILYDLTHDIYPDEASLSILIMKALGILPSLKQSSSSYIEYLHRHRHHSDVDYLHILDLVRVSVVIPLTTKEQREHRAAGNSEEDEAIFDPNLHQIRTATALSKADIKFKRVEKDSIMEINIKECTGWFRNAILEIPQLNIGMSSETLFRNLIAFEQCYHGYLNEITSYAIFMDNLISSEEDMELLLKEEVIGNWMSDEDGCKFFSNLYKDIPHNKFYYAELCKKVNYHYKLKRYTWLALLKSEKFSNPWSALAFGMAIITLIFTSWSSAKNIFGLTGTSDVYRLL